MQLIDPATADSLSQVLARYAMQLQLVAPDSTIPGSHWGDSEAGLVADQLFVRADTPLHSALHETCHYVCMNDARRSRLHTDAGGDYDEENAVCYLQILLAAHIDGSSPERLMQEMNAWGYSFRLGSAQRWFETDAEDARRWLLDSGLITPDNSVTWNLNH